MLTAGLYAWESDGWVVGLRISSSHFEVLCYRAGQSLASPISLLVDLQETAGGVRATVVDLGGNGASCPSMRGAGIGTLLCNLALEILHSEFPMVDVEVEGKAFHHAPSDQHDVQRRLRFIEGFGVVVDADANFRASLRSLRPRPCLKSSASSPPVHVRLRDLLQTHDLPK